MKKKILLILVLCCFVKVTSQNIKNDIPALNQEYIYTHINSNTFLVGEKLYYSIFILNSKIKRNNLLSKIAYLELIEESGQKVLKQKIKIVNGRGYGDFIIPEELVSGNYRLVIYTQLMRNFEGGQFYQEDIAIVNPYKKNQKLVSSVDSLVKQNYRTIELNSKLLNLRLDKKEYSKRSKVVINLEKVNDDFNFNDLSISIKKIDEIDRLNNKQATSKDFINNLKTNKPILFKDIKKLPELRGELISGKLYYKSKLVSNKLVSLSIPNKNFILKVASTNNNGDFYFNINERYTSDHGFFQVLDKNNDDYKIEINSFNPISLEEKQNNKFNISEKYNKKILKRSIYNQIENSYGVVKKDVFIKRDSTPLFFGNYNKTYSLKEFTRFPSIKETFKELISNAGIINKDSKDVFYINSLNPYLRYQTKVGVIVDGVLYQDYSLLMSYNAKNIKSISIARTKTKYILGNQFYDGFIEFKTNKGDFNSTQLVYSKKTKRVKLFKPEESKVYKPVKYIDIEKDRRIPDFRKQLLWNPNLKLNKSKSSIEVFTSDNVGEYELSLEGFTEDGKAVSIKKYFVVK